jgi:hypothetical protein
VTHEGDCRRDRDACRAEEPSPQPAGAGFLDQSLELVMGGRLGGAII